MSRLEVVIDGKVIEVPDENRQISIQELIVKFRKGPSREMSIVFDGKEICSSNKDYAAPVNESYRDFLRARW
jgi:hypothetical protein